MRSKRVKSLKKQALIMYNRDIPEHYQQMIPFKSYFKKVKRNWTRRKLVTAT